MRMIISCIVLILLCFRGESLFPQTLVFVENVKNHRYHSINLPQKMRLSYGGLEDKYMLVNDATAEGLITEFGLIPFDKLRSFNARHHKSLAERIAGYVAIGTGITLIVTGISMSDESEGVYQAVGDIYKPIAIILGIGATTSGIIMVNRRRNYYTDRWKFDVPPAESSMVPVNRFPALLTGE